MSHSAEVLELYDELGVPRDGAAAAPQGAAGPGHGPRARSFAAVRAAGPVAAGAPGAAAAPAAAAAAAPADHADLPALDQEAIEALLQVLQERPEETLERARAAFDVALTEETLRAALEQARQALAAPREAVAHVRARRALAAAAAPALPAGFTFKGMDLAAVPIDAHNHKFEEGADFLGWVVNTGRWAFGPPVGKKADFRWHDDPRLTRDFVYPLRGQGQADLDVALFADFGTGLYHSRYIARQLVTAKYPYAIHLGDVYYAGREQEFAQQFRAPLEPLLGSTRLFTMNGNHEMFSLAVPYFRYIADRRNAHPQLQEQEGSYFCLRGQSAQIIGIDTDYFGYKRFRDASLLNWLTRQLEHGRANRLTNIVLSGDEPYQYGSPGPTALLEKDLREIVVDRALVDLWFWGNTHYCALFDRTAATPFVGSCIGHGGFPYGRQKPGAASPAPVRFLETQARFPEWTRVRQDRGNNGYCVLTLEKDGALRLRYVDWMANERCNVTFVRQPAGTLSLNSVQTF